MVLSSPRNIIAPLQCVMRFHPKAHSAQNNIITHAIMLSACCFYLLTYAYVCNICMYTHYNILNTRWIRTTLHHLALTQYKCERAFVVVVVVASTRWETRAFSTSAFSHPHSLRKVAFARSLCFSVSIFFCLASRFASSFSHICIHIKYTCLYIYKFWLWALFIYVPRNAWITVSDPIPESLVQSASTLYYTRLKHVHLTQTRRSPLPFTNIAIQPVQPARHPSIHLSTPTRKPRHASPNSRDCIV